MRSQHLSKAKQTRTGEAYDRFVGTTGENGSTCPIRLEERNSPHFSALPALEREGYFHFERRFSCSSSFCSWPNGTHDAPIHFVG